MEGDGNQVVVILKRLNNDGVVFALWNSQRTGQNRQQPSRHRLQGTRSSFNSVCAQTNSDPKTRHSVVNTAAQATPNRYVSSYQVDHCRVPPPTAPPNHVSEFPPQRTKLNNYESHFEVGGHGSSQTEQQTRTDYLRSGLTWSGRAPVYCNKYTREVNAFAHSLRKYPASSPARSDSRDMMMAKLTRRTEAVNNSKRTPRTKSIRSLPTDKPPETRPSRKRSKQIQTYSRNIVENRAAYDPLERDSKSATKTNKKEKKVKDEGSNPKRESKKKIRSRPRSPVSDGNMRKKTSDFNMRYDYLNPSPARSPREEHPRLDDVRKQMRSVIRQLYRQHPNVFQVCPNIKKRFMKHKKKCPFEEDENQICAEAQEKESSPLFCRLLEYITSECEAPRCNPGSSSKQYDDNGYCPCTKSSVCTCEPISDENERIPKCIWYPEYACQCQSADEYYFSNRVYEEVANWLSEIPIQANECPENKRRRAKLAEQLAETILDLPDDNNFVKNVKAVITSCIDKMPMWNPGTQEDQLKFKKQLVETLLANLVEIPRHPDRVREAVRKFVDALKIKDDVDKKVIVDGIAKELKFFGVNAPLRDEECKDLLISEIAKTLNDLPIEFDGDKDIILDTLSNKLADDTMHLLQLYGRAEKAAGKTSLKNDFEKKLTEWLDDFGEFSEMLPPDAETKEIIDDLATKLDTLQLQGIDESIKNKMEYEVEKVLEELDIPIKVRHHLVDKLIDKVTDTVYANEKDKFTEALQQKHFEEVNKYLKNVPAVEDLSVVDQYRLKKDIADTIQKAQRDNVEDYENNIIENLENAGIMVDTNVKTQVGEIIDVVNTLPQKMQKDELKGKLENVLNDVINTSNIPRDKKEILKQKIADGIASNIEKSAITTKREIDDLKEVILEDMDTIIQEAQINESVKRSLKDNFYNILDTYFDNLKSTTNDKDVANYTMIKEINHLIDKEPIPVDIKDDLKFLMRDMIDDKLNNPYSHHLLATINDNIGNIIGDANIDQSTKDNLTKKMRNVAVTNLDNLSKQSMKDHVKGKIFKFMNSTIDKSKIADEVKGDLKQQLRNTVEENFDQKFTNEVKNNILDKVNDVVEKSPLPKSIKEILIAQLSDALAETLDELPYQTTTDHALDVVMHDINNISDEIPLPKEEQKYLTNEITNAMAEALERPYTVEERENLNQKIDDIVAQSNIPPSEKEKVANKLLNRVADQLDHLPYQKNDEYAKEKLMTYVQEVVSDLPLSSTEKYSLTKKFEQDIKANLGEDLKINRETLENSIEDIIHSTEIPPDKQDILIDKMKMNTNKILDEAFYEDDVRQYVRDMAKKIDKSGKSEIEKVELKSKVREMVDEVALSPNFMEDKNQITLDLSLENLPPGPQDPEIEERIHDIKNTIQNAALPNNNKTTLLNKVDDIAKDIQDNNDLEKLFTDLDRNIEDLPLRSNDKRALQTKLAMIADPNSEEAQQKLKTMMIKDVEGALDQVSLSKDKKNELKQKLNDVITNVDEPISNNVKNKIKDHMNKIVEENVFSKDKKNDLKNRVVNILDNVPTESGVGKDKVIKLADVAIDKANIRQHLKEDLKSQVNDILSKLYRQPYEVGAQAKAINDINDTIENAPITAYQKNNLKTKLLEIVTPEIDNLDNGGENLITTINNIIDEAPLPQAKKSKLKKRMKGIVVANTSLLSLESKMKTKENISDVIDEALLTKDQKTNLKVKLENAVNEYEPASPAKSAFTNGLINNLCNIVNDALITQEQKTNLKKRIKDSLTLILKKDLNNEQLKQIITDKITDIINDAPIARAQKEELKNNLVNTALEELTKYQAEIDEGSKYNDRRPGLFDESSLNLLSGAEGLRFYRDHTDPHYKSAAKDAIISEFDEIIHKTDLPTDNKDTLKSDLVEYLDKREEDLIVKGIDPSGVTIGKAVEDLPLPQVKKKKLKSEFVDAIKKIQEVDPELTMEERNAAKDAIISEFDEIIKKTDIPGDEKESLKSGLTEYLDTREEDLIVKGIDPSGITIGDLVHELPLPKKNKSILKTEFVEAIKKTTENILPSAKRGITTAQKNATKDAIGTKFDEIIETTGLPTDDKQSLKGDLTDYVDTREEDLIMKGIDPSGITIGNIVEDLPLPKAKKNKLKTEFIEAIKQTKEKMLPKNKQGITTAQKNATKDAIGIKFDEIIETTGLPTDDKQSLKSYLTDYVDTREEDLIIKGIDPSGITIGNIVEDLSLPKVKKTKLKTEFVDAIKQTKEKMLPRTKQGITTAQKAAAKDAIISEFDEIIEKTELPSAAKETLKSGLTEYIDDREEDLIAKGIDPSGITIGNLVQESPLSKEKQPKLKSQLVGAIKKQTENLGSDDQRELKMAQKAETKDAIISEFEEIIGKTDLSSDAKESLKSDLIDYIDDRAEDLIFKGIDPSGITIGGIVQDLPLPKEKKPNLKSQFVDAIKRTKTQVKAATMRRDKQKEAIREWLDNLPITLSEEVKRNLMNEIASDIADRQKYLQLFPGAKQSTQGEMENLQYQVFKRLGKLLDDSDMAKVMDAADDLMHALKMVEEFIEDSMQDEAVVYRQALRKIISDTFIEVNDLTAAEEEILEALKQDLVDAFVDLNFTGGTEEEQAVMKVRINNEVDKFCKEYLKRPCSTCEALDRELIKAKLYRELAKVPLPSDDSMRTEVARMKVKDTIKEMVKKITLRALTPEEREIFNEEIVILEQNLIETEKNNAGLTKEEVEFEKQNLIKDFLDKVPPKAKLRGICGSRICLRPPRICQRRPVRPPPCSLSEKDKEHLERIKERTCMAPDCLSSLMKGSKRNVSVCPRPSNATCQTEAPVCVEKSISITPCPSFVRPCPRKPRVVSKQCSTQKITKCQSIQCESQKDINPQVIMKEYYWDSIESDQPESTQRCVRHQENISSRRSPCDYSDTCPTTRRGRWSQRKTSIPSQHFESPPMSPPGSPPQRYASRNYTPAGRSSSVQAFNPPLHSTPRNSMGMYPDNENNGSRRRNSSQHEYPEASSSRYSRNERVTKLGSLTSLTQPSQRVRQPEDFGWSPEKEMSRQEFYENLRDVDEYDEDEPPCARGMDRPGYCNGRYMMDFAQRRYRPCCHKKMYPVCRESAIKQCSKCHGMPHTCPYPSYSYFK